MPTIPGQGPETDTYREIPMNVLKESGPINTYQCACGRKFKTNKDNGQHMVLHNGKTVPHCPSCNAVWAGSKLSDFQKAMADEETKLFSACVAYNGNKCRGEFIGEATNMAEFTVGVGMAMMHLGLPMEGLEIHEIDEDHHSRYKENYHMASKKDEILAHLLSMMLAHGLKPSGTLHN